MYGRELVVQCLGSQTRQPNRCILSLISVILRFWAGSLATFEEHTAQVRKGHKGCLKLICTLFILGLQAALGYAATKDPKVQKWQLWMNREAPPTSTELQPDLVLWLQEWRVASELGQLICTTE